MGKTIFAAVIASLLTAIATVLVMDSLRAEKAAVDARVRETATETERIERDRLASRVAEVEKRVSAVPRAERRAAVDDAPAPPPPTAPDGTPYVSRAELEAYAREQIGGLRAAQAVPAVPGDTKPVPKKTLEEIAREQGLSAGEEANLRNILRESEEELVHCLFGSKSIDEIKADLVAVKADPDKQSELMQTLIQNGLANAGKLMTLEKRTKKRVDEVLGPERGKKFMDAPRQPILAPEFEDILKDFGD
jgi:hypothetical protein